MGEILLIVFLFAPFIGSIARRKPGGDAWKGLTFLTCGAAVGLLYTSNLGLSIIVWFLAGIFALAADGAVQRSAREDAVLAALQEQNRLLRSAQGAQEPESAPLGRPAPKPNAAFWGPPEPQLPAGFVSSRPAPSQATRAPPSATAIAIGVSAICAVPLIFGLLFWLTNVRPSSAPAVARPLAAASGCSLLKGAEWWEKCGPALPSQASSPK